MAFEIADRVRETTTTTGTGTLDLSESAVTTYQTFATALTSPATVYYLIEHRSSDEWETGEGTYTAGSPDTLSRDTVFESSNAGSLVTLSSDIKDVYITIPATKVLLARQDETISGAWTLNGDLTAGSGSIVLDESNAGVLSVGSSGGSTIFPDSSENIIIAPRTAGTDRWVEVRNDESGNPLFRLKDSSSSTVRLEWNNEGEQTWKDSSGADTYLLRYDDTNGQFEIESTDTDGGGTNGLIVSVADGTDVMRFEGAWEGAEIATPSNPSAGYNRLYFKSDDNLYKLDSDGNESQVGGSGSGSAIILDLGDDGSNESTDLAEIATTGDTNSIFTEPSADKLLVDMGQNWPTADTVPADAIGTSEIDLSIAPTWTGEHDYSSAGIILPTATAPSPTAEGDVAWDSDDDKLVVGDGTATVTLVKESRSLTGGNAIDAIGDLSADRTIAVATDGIQTDELDLSIAPAWTGTHDFSGGGLVLPTGSAVSPTAEGQAAWDTDDDKLRVGDGTATVTVVNESRTLTGGAGIGTLGDLSADRTVVVDITGATDLGASVAGADEVLVADSSDGAAIKKTTAQDIADLGSGGSAVVLDLGDDGANESSDLNEIATTGDTNSIFTEDAADKLLIDAAQNWPTADNVVEANVDHDALNNFVANEHIDHSTVSISAGDGLSGGGDLTATRTLDLDITGATDLASPATDDELVLADTSNAAAIRKADVASVVNLADHDALTNFVADEHIDHSTVTVTGTGSLNGGGDLTASRTLDVADGGIDTTELADGSVTSAKLSADTWVTRLVDSPNGHPPVSELQDGESVEITVVVPDTETLKVYRWGAYRVSDGTAPTDLDVELLDGSDTVQATANTTDNESTSAASPVASHQNTSGSASVYKLRAANDTGSVEDVGAHFAYVVE